jgi:hypothetical protein
MPEELRVTLLNRYGATFPGRLERVDSQVINNKGQAIHMDCYNRYTFEVSRFFVQSMREIQYLQGTNSPSDVHPDALQKLGKKKWISLKNRRLLPYQSKELMGNIEDYNRFQELFAPILSWQNELVCFFITFYSGSNFQILCR